MVGWMIMAWLPTYYSEHFHLSEATAGLYATGYLYPVSLAGLVIGGVVADRLTKRNRRARILVPAIGLLVAAPAIFLASSTTAVYIAIVCFVFYGFARIFSDGNLMPILCMIADKRYRATGYGILNMFACVVGGLGIYASGAVRDAHINLSVMFKVAALSMVVCSGLLFMIKIKYDDTETR
jgi:sugar phosphate permease